MSSKSTDIPLDQKYENLRTEYSALTSYHNSVVSFRLTLLGFYLAAVALIVTVQPKTPAVNVLGIILTVSLYGFELRTRNLYRSLGGRGMEIEQKDWGFQRRELRLQETMQGEKLQKEFRRMLPFYSRQYTRELKEQYKIEVKQFPSKEKILSKLLVDTTKISHSNTLDLLYIGVLLFFVYSLLSPLIPIP